LIDDRKYIEGCQYLGVDMATKTVPVAEVQACCPSVLDAPLSDEDAHDLATVFAALGDPVRLRLLSLVAAGDEVCSCNLEAPLGRAQPTISHHTKILAGAGLIEGEKRGRWVWWRIVPARVDAVRAALEHQAPVFSPPGTDG
jgi:ArsR family transcriptional regulator